MDELKGTLYQTVTDINAWQAVLKQICVLTGATKGLISLRDHQTSAFVLPNDMHCDLASPLIYGFSEHEVAHYIAEVMQADPWIANEQRHFPFSPYAMSDHLPAEALKATPLWPWLAPQGISDTVVMEIGAGKDSWVALNIYYSVDDSEVKQRVLTLLSELQGLITKLWQRGQQRRLTQAPPQSLDYFIEQQFAPSWLVNAQGNIMRANRKANALLAAKTLVKGETGSPLKLHDAGMQAQFSEAMATLATRALEEGPFCESVIAGEGYTLRLTILEPVEQMPGEDTALRLVAVESPLQHSHNNGQPIWEHPALTPRERQLVEVMAHGGKVIDFMHRYQLAKSTAHNYWTSVKKKLQIRDRSEIFAQHQLFLLNR